MSYKTVTELEPGDAFPDVVLLAFSMHEYNYFQTHYEYEYQDNVIIILGRKTVIEHVTDKVGFFHRIPGPSANE